MQDGWQHIFPAPVLMRPIRSEPLARTALARGLKKLSALLPAISHVLPSVEQLGPQLFEMLVVQANRAQVALRASVLFVQKLEGQ